MSSPASRLLRLLGLLQAQPVWTGSELAERLGVTGRSVRRDIERLRELGYPVRAAPGVGGGYQLGAGRALPPLLLDDDEAVAVTVALALSAGSLTDGAEAAVRALGKIEQVLPARLREQVLALQESTDTLMNPGDEVDTGSLAVIAAARRARLRMRFSYAASDGASSERRVEPYRLVATGRRWYLMAYDLDRDDWRTFRVDRITDPQATTWRFAPREHPDPVEFVQRAITRAPYRFVARIRIAAPAGVVRARFSAAAAGVRRDGDGCVLEAGFDRLDALYIAYLMGDLDYVVLGPPELIEAFERAGRRMLAAT